MKKVFSATVVLALCSIATFLQGCLKDSCRNVYTIYVPVYKNLSEVRASMKSGPATPLVNPGKIYASGNFIFLNEVKKGIHVIDNTDPSHPRNISFINIPGNIDLAVKGNYLYADCYSDIVVFDISNPASIMAKKFMDNVIKEYNYYWNNQSSPDSVSILVDYAKKDTMVNCDTYNMWRNCAACSVFPGGILLTAAPPASNSGTGGSMARFSIVNNYLYTVSNVKLYALNLDNPSAPVLTNSKVIAGGIETIYPLKDKLFIGSTTGMFIYDISNPSDPLSLGQFTHIGACDPVVSDGQYAYVTLRSGTSCNSTANEMDVLDIADLSHPSMVKTYPMTSPHGLSKAGDKLFVCDGIGGLKIYNATSANHIQLVKTLSGMETYDVITLNGEAIVVARDGLYQYDYSTGADISLLSRIPVLK